VSTPAGHPVSDPGSWPPHGDGVRRLTPNLSLVVGRGPGTVEVTVGGELDLAGCELLQGVLTDLIEGQGNLTVAVDLGRAIVEPEALIVFIEAARQASRRGAKFILNQPPAGAEEKLLTAGNGHRGP